MSNNKYPQEFKDEAVRQVVEKGYSVPDVSKRLGISDKSLYYWVKERYAFIKSRLDIYRVKAMCQVLNVHRSVFTLGLNNHNLNVSKIT